MLSSRDAASEVLWEKELNMKEKQIYREETMIKVGVWGADGMRFLTVFLERFDGFWP